MTDHRSRPPRRPPPDAGTGEGAGPWGPRRTPRPDSAPAPDAGYDHDTFRPPDPRHAGARGPGGPQRRERAPQGAAPYADRHRVAPGSGERSGFPRRGAERAGFERPGHARPGFGHDEPHGHGAHHDEGHEPHPARAQRQAELRLYGLNAIHAVFARRPQAIRKLYLLESRIPAVQPLLKWCVANRVGYRVAEEGDLDRLAASSHHEGVVADVLREEPVALSPWLRDLPAGPHCALWLDGVGNPHNFGAILRSAAHFGVGAILLPKHSPLALSGAAARVAEGGAEAVPLVRMGRTDNSIAQLRGAGFTLAATLVQGGRDVFAADLPERVVYVIGAEGEGMDRELAQACDLRVSIPGSGTVESLNVAAATAVLLARWRHR